MKLNKWMILSIAGSVLTLPAVTFFWLGLRLSPTSAKHSATSADSRHGSASHAQEDLPPLEKPWVNVTSEVNDLLRDLQHKKRLLDDREQAILEREGRFQAEKQELERLREEIARERREFERSILVLEKTEAENLQSMSALCSELSPRSALQLMRQLPLETAVKILRLLKNDVRTSIIEEMIKEGPTRPEAVAEAALWTEQLRLLQRQSSSP